MQGLGMGRRGLGLAQASLQYPGSGAETMDLVGQVAALGWALPLLLTFSSVPAGKGR